LILDAIDVVINSIQVINESQKDSPKNFNKKKKKEKIKLKNVRVAPFS
jgi:hypothetical protein